jgi:hypothetical protein
MILSFRFTSTPARMFQCRCAMLLVTMLLAALADNVSADAYLPPIGGSGGGQFKAPCPTGQNLAGFELRTGDDVDAIRPVCVIAYGPRDTSAPSLTVGSGLVATGPQSALFGSMQTLAAGWYGGTGGDIEPLLCPQSTPIVIGIDVAAEGADTVIVNNIHLFCGQALAAQTADANPSAIFDGPGYTPSPGSFGFDGTESRHRIGSQRCPAGQVAIGMHGRSGRWLDSIGLICDAPRIMPPPIALGKVQPSRQTKSDAPRPICDVAREARAKNSPAASSLEAQCAAAKEKPGTALGRVKPGVALGKVRAAPVPDAPRPICDVAREARARNSPAAPSLEAQCRAAAAKPPVAANPGQLFAPPLFDDGARLWACADAADGQANGTACAGLKAGAEYCRTAGYSGALQPRAGGAPGLTISIVAPGRPVTAVNGDTCATGECAAISELHCAP